MTQGSFGLTAQIDVSGTPTAWVKIIDLPFPDFTKFIAESTTHDSAGGYYEATATGKRRVQPLVVTLAWDAAQATHAAVLAAFNSDDPVTFSVADPDGDETIAVEVHVERVGRMSAQGDIVKCEVGLHPTGQPTIT